MTLPQSDVVPGLVYGNWGWQKTLRELAGSKSKSTDRNE